MSRRVCSPRIVGRLFVALAVMLLGSTLTLSQSSPTDSPAAAHMRALNNSLLSLHGHMQQADANSGRTLRAQAATAIAQRSAALGSLIQTDPHAALSFAFSAELLADLAAKVPQSSLWLESHATLSGPIERLTVDSADLKSSYSRLQMRVGQRRVGLHFAGPEPTYLLRANVVQVTGVLLGHEMAVASTTMVPATGSMVNTNNGPARLAGVTPVPASLRFLLTTAMTIIGVLTISVACVRDQLKQITIFALVFLLVISSSIENAAAASTCSTTGVQNTAVLVVNFQDVQNLATTQQISDAFFDTSSGRSLDGFWQESSAGRVSAVGNVFGPFTLAASTSYSCSNAIQIFYDAVSAAAAAGIHLQNYTRINVVLPSLSCGWAGFTMTGSAGAGCNLWSTSDGTLTASLSYEVDSYFTQATNAWPSARDQAVAVVSHENGHQLGLEHSGTISDQPAAVVGT